MATKKLCELKVRELEIELKERDLEITGTKKILQERLRKALLDENLDPETYLFENELLINMRKIIDVTFKKLEDKFQVNPRNLEEKSIQKLKENEGTGFCAVEETLEDRGHKQSADHAPKEDFYVGEDEMRSYVSEPEYTSAEDVSYGAEQPGQDYLIEPSQQKEPENDSDHYEYGIATLSREKPGQEIEHLRNLEPMVAQKYARVVPVEKITVKHETVCEDFPPTTKCELEPEKTMYFPVMASLDEFIFVDDSKENEFQYRWAAAVVVKAGSDLWSSETASTQTVDTFTAEPRKNLLLVEVKPVFPRKPSISIVAISQSRLVMQKTYTAYYWYDFEILHLKQRSKEQKMSSKNVIINYYDRGKIRSTLCTLRN